MLDYEDESEISFESKQQETSSSCSVRPAKDVLRDLRSKYKTVHSLRTHTCRYRVSYDGDLDEQGRKCRDVLLEKAVSDPEREAVRAFVSSYGRLKWVPTGNEDLDAAAVVHRKWLLPEHVRGVKITAKEALEGEHLSKLALRAKHSNVLVVQGADEMLRAAREIVSDCERRGVYDLALALMLMTGRRTVEILNGRTRLVKLPDDAEGTSYGCAFQGQVKRRCTVLDATASRSVTQDDATTPSQPIPDEEEVDEDDIVVDLEEGDETERRTLLPSGGPSYTVPLLHPCAVVAHALDVLRRKQGQRRGWSPNMSNKIVSQRYQSSLGQHLKHRQPFGPCSVTSPHQLRAVYVQLVHNLFVCPEEWSVQEVATRVCGHAETHTGLAYTAVRCRGVSEPGCLGPLPSG